MGSSLVKQHIVKNITGLHNVKFRISPPIVHCDFIPYGKKQQVTYLQLVTYL